MTSLKQKAYEHIRGRLLRGELAPGSRLSNRKLAAELGISFIPVREAIGQLVSEGLAVHHSNVGVVVRNPSREELVDLYDLRLALECHAVKVAARQVGPSDISDLEDRIRQMADIAASINLSNRTEISREVSSELMAIDAAFHLIVLRAAGNSLVIKTVSDLRLMERVFGHRRCAWDALAVDRICNEHNQIVESLRQRDEAGASQAMADHIRRGQEVALEEFDRRRASAAAQRAFSDQLPNHIRSFGQT